MVQGQLMVGETHNAPKNTRAEEGQPATIRLSVSRSTDQLLIINLPPPPNDVRRDAALKLARKHPFNLNPPLGV
jgi:hypothetical protein